MDIIDIGLWAAYLLLLGALITSVAMPLINALKTPGAFVKSLIGVGSLVVLFGISYVISGSEVTREQAAFGISATSSKMIGAGLIMFYITLVMAIIGMVYSEINKALK